MFWEVNSYSKSIDTLLNKEDVTLRELLDDEDILQDYKEQNKNLTQFLHRAEIIDELVSMITTEPPSDVADNVRFKYSNIACEILTSEVPVLIERLVSSRSTLEKLYAFLEQDPPLNPLLTSFCSKTFGMLLSKKSDQDWFSYQCVCLQMLEFIKSRPGFLNTIYKHMSAPVVVDLLFQIITSIEGDELRNSLFQWLSEQQLVCNLIGMLGNEADADKHQNIANLLCELISTGRSARQNEIQKRGYGYSDSATDSNDPLIHILEDESTTDLLLDLILSNKTESAVVSGITIILKLLENPIINEPASDTALQYLADAEKEHHKRIIANIVQQIKPRVKELHELLVNPPTKFDIRNTVTLLSPPFGSTRLHICTLLSVLIETGNQDIIDAICETDFFNVLLDLFKQYCWNNILHSQVKKCFSYAFSAFVHGDDNTCTPSALQTHILVKCNVASKLIDCWKHNDESQSKENGRRLGYMGHLIYMFDSLNLLVLVSHQFRALVESNLTEDELSYWKLVTDPNNGYLVSALKQQKSYLGGIDPNQSDSYDTSASKDFQDESFTGDYYNDIEANSHNIVDDINDTATRLFEARCSMQNLSTFDIRDSDIKYNFDELMNEFRDDISDNNIFGSSGSTFPTSSNLSDSILPKNDTDWADFDSHFSDFQLSDNIAFPPLEQNNHNNRNDEMANSNNPNAYSSWNDDNNKNPSSSDSSPVRVQNTKDIKRWASVVSDIDTVQTTDEFNAEKTTEETNASVQNANTISYTTSASEQIDNAELQEKELVSSKLDDNENDKESKLVDCTTNAASPKNETMTTITSTTTTSPVETDINNGPFTDESNAKETIDNKNDNTSNEHNENTSVINDLNVSDSDANLTSSSEDSSSSPTDQSTDIISDV
ncbi:serine/threonine-protein phosphatase 6 regulatory subunit 3-B [Contarinia nasturtii]|uniref:serine/threonine-protein phosphatase 6 regulatory subunit 3-B n=1 Tax=Contarinia nasturtii TaxID=265458 RepID=UPI0012D44DE1|nr:serine/threonine-protein phosphatase 6 regulatory subunit 3-B [Contarinia nasturtii]XP_031622171.1 serine/threonine-protein phosphatase 6 regulatory subunit 3-B [Contarinia nasturtii]